MSLNDHPRYFGFGIGEKNLAKDGSVRNRTHQLIFFCSCDRNCLAPLHFRQAHSDCCRWSNRGSIEATAVQDTQAKCRKRTQTSVWLSSTRTRFVVLSALMARARIWLHGPLNALHLQCKPKKCRQECHKSCPVVRLGMFPLSGRVFAAMNHMRLPLRYCRQAMYRGDTIFEDRIHIRRALHWLRYLHQEVPL